MAKQKRIDPTANVLQLVKAATKRTDDLSMAYQKLTDRELQWMDKFTDMRSQYEEKLVLKQSARHDANEETLRILIKNVQDNDSQQIDRLISRVSALELSQSQNTGKSSIWTNPILLIILSLLFGYIAAKYLK